MRKGLILSILVISISLMSVNIFEDTFGQSKEQNTEIIIEVNPDTSDKGDYPKQSGDGVKLGIKIKGPLQDNGKVTISTTGKFLNPNFEITLEDRRNFTVGSPKHLFVLDYPFAFDVIYSTSVRNGDFTETIKWIPLSSSGESKLIEDVDSNYSKIPPWLKNNVKWWIDGQISDEDFLVGIKYLISNQIIKVSFFDKKYDLQINKTNFLPSKYYPDELILTGWACNHDDVCYQQHIMCEMNEPNEVYPTRFEILRSYNYGEFEHKMLVNQDWEIGKYEIKCKHLGEQIGTIEFEVTLENTTENTTDVIQSKIPEWIRSSANWWYQDLVTEDEFLKSIEYIVENKIIRVDGHFDSQKSRHP